MYENIEVRFKNNLIKSSAYEPIHIAKWIDNPNSWNKHLLLARHQNFCGTHMLITLNKINTQ